MLFIPDGIKLGDQIISSATGEITRSTSAAKCTTTFGDGTISVRAGETGIQHYFENLIVKLVSHFVIPRMESFISP
jgi:hypothetical protein